MVRSKDMITAADDHFGFAFNVNRKSALLAQRGRQLQLRPGDAVSISQLEPAILNHGGGRHIGLMFPIKALEPLVGDVEAKAACRVRRENPVLRLLKGYLPAALRNDVASAQFSHLVANQVRDLVALAIGTTEEGARGARDSLTAARLHSVKADIFEFLGSSNLSVADVALRQGVTPRHVHRLFETEGTTFSQFVLAERLARAYRLLADRRQAHQTITAIAFAAGFGDLSYFNRSFRRRYGLAPSELRRQAGQPR